MIFIRKIDISDSSRSLLKFHLNWQSWATVALRARQFRSSRDAEWNIWTLKTQQNDFSCCGHQVVISLPTTLSVFTGDFFFRNAKRKTLAFDFRFFFSLLNLSKKKKKIALSCSSACSVLLSGIYSAYKVIKN